MTKEDILATLEAGIVLGNELQKRDALIRKLQEQLNEATRVSKEVRS